jgi:hypothetical protein
MVCVTQNFSDEVLSNAVQDRQLRVADWRFLLPDPSPQRLVCFTDGLMGKVASTIARSTVTAQHARPGGHDLG